MPIKLSITNNTERHNIMKNIPALLLATAAITGIIYATPAAAQADFAVVTSVETNFVGAAVGVAPDYVGSDEYTGGVAPAFRYEFGDNRYVQLVGNYASANIVPSEHYRFGPAVRYRFGRDDNVEDEAVSELSEIDGAIEAGLTVGGNWILDGNPRNRVAVTADALWDVGDAHEGYTGTISTQYWDQVSDAFDLGIAGSVQYGDENYTNTYFGITPGGSAASGLDEYDADGGVASVSIQPMAVMHLSENWHVGAGVRFTQLTGDSTDSPIVDDRGSSTQVIGGVGVIYSWGSKVNTR